MLVRSFSSWQKPSSPRTLQWGEKQEANPLTGRGERERKGRGEIKRNKRTWMWTPRAENGQEDRRGQRLRSCWGSSGAHVLAPFPQQGTGGSARRYGRRGCTEPWSKPALISAQRHQCQTGWDVSSAQCQGSSHGVLSQREIDIISNTQLWREEGEAGKRIPQCTFMGGERDRSLTLLWPHERRHK